MLLALNLLQLGKRDLAATLCERALEAAPGPDSRAYALALQACVALRKGRVPEALMYLEKGQGEAAAPRIRSMLAFYLGVVLYDRGEARQALERFREARRHAGTDAAALASCNDMGACCLAVGDPGQALRAFEDAEELGLYSARADVKRMRAAAAGGAGIAYANLGEEGLAIRCFRRSLRAYREAGNARGVADQLINIGLMHRRQLRLDEAARHLQAALGLAYTDGYQDGVLFARRQLGEALALQGRHQEEAALDREISRRHPGIAGLLGRAARKSF